MPGKWLEQTFEVLLEGYEPKKTEILDFGAAKLRNTLYLLKKGYNVCSCEFNELFEKSAHANHFLEEANKFENFNGLITPEEFPNFDKKFDVILLINVLNAMPIPSERDYALKLCRQKMKKEGALLIYSQRYHYDEPDIVGRAFDGVVKGRGKEIHTFYKYFYGKELEEMMDGLGFKRNKRFKFPKTGNKAYVFNVSD